MGGYRSNPGGLRKKQQCQIVVGADTHAKLKALTKERHVSMDAVISAMLDKEESTN